MNKKALILIPIALVVLGQLSSKYGMQLFNANENLFFIFLILGYMALFLRGFVWVYILKKIELSVAYPMISFSYVIIIVLSFYIFDETISFNKVIGAIFITLGTILIGKNGNYKRN